MNEADRPVRQYNGFAITMTPQFTWAVTGPDLKDQVYFESMGKAIDFCDDRLKVRERQQKRKISIPLRNEDGQVVMVTGINANTGNLTGTETDVYPDVHWLVTCLRHQKALQAQLDALHKKIAPFKIRQRRAYGRISAENYESKLDELERDISTLTKKAMAEEPPLALIEELPNGQA